MAGEPPRNHKYDARAVTLVHTQAGEPPWRMSRRGSTSIFSKNNSARHRKDNGPRPLASCGLVARRLGLRCGDG
eukprot:8941317-Pyramimonas_sp.AAC.1